MHLSLVPILGFKALLAVFGAGSYVPFKALAVLDLVFVALAVGVVCRSWWGAWWGLAPVALIVTLGAGGWTWLWPFQVGETLATVAGILALLAVGRGNAVAIVWRARRYCSRWPPGARGSAL